jgi:hypothetical protein
MKLGNGWLGWTVILFALSAGGADAAVARFHFIPVEVNGCTQMQPASPDGAGTCETWFGLRREHNPCPPRPNMFVTLCHKLTGQNVTVPLCLPLGTPVIMHRPAAIMYNYGSFAVTIEFFADGSVDVVYNSGLFRGL